VEGDPDRGAPPVSLWRKKKKGGAVLGRRESKAGPLRAASARGKSPLAWEGLRAEKEKRDGEGNWASWKRRERGERKVFLFLLNSFQIRFSNFQTSIKQKSMHSNHDAQTLIISKLF
jgi:hypothetical protein